MRFLSLRPLHVVFVAVLVFGALRVWKLASYRFESPESGVAPAAITVPTSPSRTKLPTSRSTPEPTPGSTREPTPGSTREPTALPTKRHNRSLHIWSSHESTLGDQMFQFASLLGIAHRKSAVPCFHGGKRSKTQDHLLRAFPDVVEHGNNPWCVEKKSLKPYVKQKVPFSLELGKYKPVILPANDGHVSFGKEQHFRSWRYFNSFNVSFFRFAPSITEAVRGVLEDAVGQPDVVRVGIWSVRHAGSGTWPVSCNICAVLLNAASALLFLWLSRR